MASTTETESKRPREGHYLSSVDRISADRIKEIPIATIGQRDNPLWQ